MSWTILWHLHSRVPSLSSNTACPGTCSSKKNPFKGTFAGETRSGWWQWPGDKTTREAFDLSHWPQRISVNSNNISVCRVIPIKSWTLRLWKLLFSCHGFVHFRLKIKEVFQEIHDVLFLSSLKGPHIVEGTISDQFKTSHAWNSRFAYCLLEEMGWNWLIFIWIHNVVDFTVNNVTHYFNTLQFARQIKQISFWIWNYVFHTQYFKTPLGRANEFYFTVSLFKYTEKYLGCRAISQSRRELMDLSWSQIWVWHVF